MVKAEKKRRLGQVLGTVRIIMAWVVLGISLIVMILTIVSLNLVEKQDRTFFGYRFFIVSSDSMAATDFAEGDLIIVQEVDPATLVEGDIITFVSSNWGSLGEVTTHKIRRLASDPMGNPGFVTYGTTTNSDDETVVTYEHILGRYRGRIPAAGRLFAYVQTLPGMLTLLIIPFVLVIFLHGWNLFNSFRTWRDEEVRILEQKQEAVDRMMDALDALGEKYGPCADAAFLQDARSIMEEARRELASLDGDPVIDPLDSAAPDSSAVPDSSARPDDPSLDP